MFDWKKLEMYNILINEQVIPEFPCVNPFSDAAEKLYEIANEYPIGYIRLYMFRIYNTITGGYIGKSMKKYVKYVGQNQIRLILTKRLSVKPTWHLSVLPERYGELFSWEEKAIKKAFEIPENAIHNVEGKELVWYWE